MCMQPCSLALARFSHYAIYIREVLYHQGHIMACTLGGEEGNWCMYYYVLSL